MGDRKERRGKSSEKDMHKLITVFKPPYPGRTKNYLAIEEKPGTKVGLVYAVIVWP